ncbi:MAG: conjugal transfer protein TraX [Treponema sp.]|nr:conjugal transfer protein TraX [Treponema sp.]
MSSSALANDSAANAVVESKIGNFFTANTLKMIAMALMFIDHYAVVLLPQGSPLYMLFRLLGRIVMPVICFFIAEGYHYTSSKKKYILRLFVLALISHIPFNITFGHSLSPLEATSVIWALVLGLVALAAWKSDKLNIVVKAAIIALCCAAAWTANWNFIGVLWILAFGMFHGNFKRQIIAFCAVGLFVHLALVYYRFGFTHWHQLGIFLPIPLLAMYNGKLGKKSKVLAYSFYVFYPAHLLLLHFMGMFIN